MRCRHLGVVAVVLALTALGCSSSDETSDDGVATTVAESGESSGPVFEPADESTESAATTTVAPTTTVADFVDGLGPLGETTLDVDTGEGSVQIGEAEVPDAVAASFPVMDDFAVQIASETGGDAGFSGVTQVEFTDVVAFYRAELPAAGYSVTEREFVDDVVAVFEFEGRDGLGQLAISSAPGGGRSVLVTFNA